MITLEELKRIMPYAKRAAEFVEPLNKAMQEFDISATVQREMSFLAQIGHESGSLNYVREIGSGNAYEGRKDLGNTEPGDGPRFKGRGLIQITGRANYAKCGEALDLDLIANPELLEAPENACRSAGWFWKANGLNEIADKGDFKLLTKRINGGFNGFADRWALYEKAQKVLA